MEYHGDGLLDSLKNIHGIHINMIKKLIVDFIIAAGDTVSISIKVLLCVKLIVQ